MGAQQIPDKTEVRSGLVGVAVARFKIIEKSGEGPRGAVYRAEHLDTGQPAALKLTTDAIDEREVRACSSLKHPGIAEVYSFGRLPDGRHWVATEFLQGEGLNWALHRSGTLLVGEVVTILHQVADALAAAHQRGLVHGNLRPSSVFMCRPSAGGVVAKLLDFGLAPQPGAPLPSVEGDLRAVGMLGFTMLTGLAEAPRPLPRPLSPVLPLSLDELVADLVEAASKLRPKSAAEVRDRLVPLLPVAVGGAPQVAAPVPSPAAPAPQASSKPSRRMGWLAVAVALLGCAGALAAWWQWPGPTPDPVMVAAPLAPPRGPAPERPASLTPPEPIEKAKQPHLTRPTNVPLATETQLEARIDRLEAKLRKRPGDHSEALHALNKLRLRLSGDPDPAERKDVAQKIEVWEHVHLK